MRAGSLLFQAARENVAKCRACNFAKTQSSLAEKLAGSDSCAYLLSTNPRRTKIVVGDRRCFVGVCETPRDRLEATGLALCAEAGRCESPAPLTESHTPPTHPRCRERAAFAP